MVGSYNSRVTCQTIDSLGIATIDTTYVDSIRVTSFQDTVLVVGAEHMYYDASLDSCCHGFIYSGPFSYFDIAIVDTGYHNFSFYRFQTNSSDGITCIWKFY